MELHSTGTKGCYRETLQQVCWHTADAQGQCLRSVLYSQPLCSWLYAMLQELLGSKLL